MIMIPPMEYYERTILEDIFYFFIKYSNNYEFDFMYEVVGSLLNSEMISGK